MPYFYYVFLIVGACVSTAFCYHRRLGFNSKNVIFKTISSLCFIFTAVCALTYNPAALTYGALIIMGGALGMAGDIVLDLKGVYKDDEQLYLKSGFLFFLFGHIFYFTAIIYTAKLRWTHVLIAVGISALLGIGNVLTGPIMKLDFGKLKGLVGIYGGFLFMTTVISVIAMITSGFATTYIIMTVGAVLFLLSDLVLSGTYFGTCKDRPFDYFINHFLYYAAQYVIASSVLFVE